MKPFLLWLVASGVLFGAGASGYHWYLLHHPRTVLVVLDSSHSMRPHWSEAIERITTLGGARYTEYALWTEKRKVHPLRASLDPGSTAPFAPRDFSRLREWARAPQVRTFSRRVLLTNAPPQELSDFEDWEVLRISS